MTDETINVELLGGAEREWLRTGFDLVIREPGREERRIPLSYAQMTIGSPGLRLNDVELRGEEIANKQAVLHYRQGQVFFTNSNPQLAALVNGKPATFKQLSDGDEIAFGEVRIQLVGLMEQLGFLEGYTPPYRDHHWSLGTEPCTIGRAGRRENRVTLDDPTVSREHATIEYTSGAFFLRPESANSPTLVNGERVSSARVLADGDLVQVGQQVLRFRAGRGSARPRSLLPQEATILFADIWDYSSLSESRPLEEVIGQMNEFYKAMGQVIVQHRGMLMTYLGDAMMAVFGAEGVHAEDPARAVAAALAMQDRLEDLNRQWEAAGKPPLRIGVGINTGEVMVGDVGFTGRREFAAMGDNTNLAARIEKLTREFDAEIIISGSTESAVSGKFATRPLGERKVKGRDAPVALFEVLGGLE